MSPARSSSSSSDPTNMPLLTRLSSLHGSHRLGRTHTPHLHSKEGSTLHHRLPPARTLLNYHRYNRRICHRVPIISRSPRRSSSMPCSGTNRNHRQQRNSISKGRWRRKVCHSSGNATASPSYNRKSTHSRHFEERIQKEASSVRCKL